MRRTSSSAFFCISSIPVVGSDFLGERVMIRRSVREQKADILLYYKNYILGYLHFKGENVDVDHIVKLYSSVGFTNS